MTIYRVRNSGFPPGVLRILAGVVSMIQLCEVILETMNTKLIPQFTLLRRVTSVPAKIANQVGTQR